MPGVVAVLIALLLPLQGFAFENATPYPLLEGSPNAQEIFYSTTPRDVASNPAVQFTLASRVMSLDVNKNFSPNTSLTQGEALAIAVNAAGKKDQVKIDPKDWKAGYIKMSKDMGLLTKEEALMDAEKYDGAITNRTFAAWMGKALEGDFLYRQAPEDRLTRLEAAVMIYQNKELIIKKLQTPDPQKSQAGTPAPLIYKGEVQSKQPVSDKGKESLLTRVKSDTGGFFDVLTNPDKNFPVSLNGQIQNGPGALPEGIKAEFYLKDGRVYFAMAQYINQNTAKGTFEGLKGSNIVIKDFTDKTRIYTLSPNVEYFTRQEGNAGPKTKTIAKTDLLYGQEVSLTLKDNIVEQVFADLFIDPDLDGYIPPQSRMIPGRVLEVARDHILLENNQRYDVLPTTTIYREGKPSDISYLKQGDLVKLYFDDLYSSGIAKLDIEGSQRQAESIMKGTITSYAQGNMRLSLHNVKILSGNTWQVAQSEYSNMQLPGTVYVGGTGIDKSKLNQYKDQTIYMVVTKNQNNNKIEKANILLGTPLSFSDQIQKVDPVGSYLSIDGVISNYSKGTLIVKDGRIVDEKNIREKLGAYVETGAANNAASLIVMDTALTPDHAPQLGYTIYRATLDDVFTYKFVLYNDLAKDGKPDRYYYINQGNKWETRRAATDDPMIRFSEDTVFQDVDVKSTQSKIIPIDTIKNLRYTDRRDDDGKYLERQVYVVVRNGVAVGVSFEKDILTTSLVNAQNTMLGKVVRPEEKAEGVIKSLKLREVSKYNLLRELFVPQPDAKDEKGNPKYEEIDLSKALVIKDGKVLPEKAYGELYDKKVRVIYKQLTTKTNQAIVVIVEN